MLRSGEAWQADWPLTEYEALLAASPDAIEAIPGAVYLCDSEGWLVRYNAEAAVAWGRKPRLDEPKERFCGSHRLFLLDGTPLAREECPMALAIAAGSITRNAEVVMERPDGSRIVALVNIRPLKDRHGEIQGAINCFQDISHYKKMEKDSIDQRQALEDFFENSPIGLHIVDREGVILRANKAELDLLGYAESEYIGRRITEFHADSSVISDILQRLSNGEQLDRYPARLRAADGSVRHVLITSNGRFIDGKFVNSRCSTIDITDLRGAENARRDSEARLAATYEAATVGIAEADALGRLLRVNDALCQMLGRSRQDLLAMTFFDYTDAKDRMEDAALYLKQVDGELDNYTIRKQVSMPDGSRRYLDVHSSAVREQDGGFRYGVRVVQDVTETKRMDDQLRQSERQLREVLEALPAAVYTTDAEGHITYYNKAAVEMAGRTPDPGEKWCVTWRLYSPDGTPLPHEECPMAIALKEDRVVRGVEAIAERPDGTRVPFIPYPTPLHDAEGRLVGAINMLVDITERKLAEDYAGRLAAIVESSDDAIISKDLDGIIQTWNRAAERLFGYRASEIIGKPIQVLLPSDRQNEEPMILNRIKSGEHIDHYETVRRRQNGELLDVSLTVSPLRDPRGRIVGASKIARDITEKRREEERRQLLVNELNHRVKNTLATVQSLAAQTFRGENPALFFQQFERRLLALSRAHDLLTEESWEGVNFKELIQRTLEPLCVSPEHHLKLAGPPLRLRPKAALALSMAFHELCTNALKFGALRNPDGHIEIAWRVTVSSAGNYLALRWAEVNGPPVEVPQRKGFGSRLLERALRHELGANVALFFHRSGVICEIGTPIA